MSSIMGNKIKVSVFGQSHSKGIGVVIDGRPAGKKIDLEKTFGIQLDSGISDKELEDLLKGNL